MNIDNLRECVDLARTLSFTQTAQRYFITQPVLSKHVANVEQGVGDRDLLAGKERGAPARASGGPSSSGAKSCSIATTRCSRRWNI